MTQAAHHRKRGWLLQCSFALLLLGVLLGGLHAARAHAAQPPDDGLTSPAAPSLPDAAYVNVDGTLKTGAQANVDVSGWQVTLDPLRGPILALQPRIQAAGQPDGWTPLGQGANNTVFAMVITGTDIYVGGAFTSIPGCTGCAHIAKWDGTSWSPVGGGTDGIWVRALAVHGTDLYVGGNFTSAGGCTTNCKNLAKWNGTEWSPLGTGTNYDVMALAAADSGVYAGGVFTSAGDCTTDCQHIAKWDGSGWSPLSTGVNTPLSVIAVMGNDVYAGGSFTSAGACSSNCNSIAKWNGNEWSPLGTGMVQDKVVYAIAISGTELYVGGTFTGAGSCSASLCKGIARWDGANWSPLGEGVSGDVWGIAFIGTDVYAGGQMSGAASCGTLCAGIAKWDGTAWSPLGTGIAEGVMALVTDSDAVYAGGGFASAGTCSTADGCSRIARYTPLPALASTKLVTPQIDVAYGGLVTYTLVVTNTGGFTETAAQVRDVLPAQTHFGAWIENPGASVTGDSITWQGDIAPAATITFAFTAGNIGTPSTVVTNSAVISGSTQIVTATATYSTKRGSSTGLQSTANPVFVGEALGFTVTVGNVAASSIAASAFAGPTGVVSVTDLSGAIALTGTLASGKVVLAAPQLAAGIYTVTATYFGNSRYEGSVSSALLQLVQLPATAVNDAAGTPQDTPVTVPVLANDLGPVVGGLVVSALPVLPAHGAASISLDQQTVIYTPTAGFAGYDSFTYTATDTYGNADSALATIVVTAKAQTSAPPQIAPVAPLVSASRQFISPHATVGVELPNGFFTGTVTDKDILFLSYTPILTPTSQTSTPPGTLTFGGLQFDLALFLNDQPQHGVQFAVPITLTIDYDPTVLNGLNAATLAVYFWNGTAWSTEGIDVVARDVPNHTITIAVHHLSDFAFFAAVPTGEEPGPEPALHQELFLPALGK